MGSAYYRRVVHMVFNTYIFLWARLIYLFFIFIFLDGFVRFLIRILDWIKDSAVRMFFNSIQSQLRCATEKKLN